MNFRVGIAQTYLFNLLGFCAGIFVVKYVIFRRYFLFFRNLHLHTKSKVVKKKIFKFKTENLPVISKIFNPK